MKKNLIYLLVLAFFTSAAVADTKSEELNEIQMITVIKSMQGNLDAFRGQTRYESVESICMLAEMQPTDLVIETALIAFVDPSDSGYGTTQRSIHKCIASFLKNTDNVDLQSGGIDLINQTHIFADSGVTKHSEIENITKIGVNSSNNLIKEKSIAVITKSGNISGYSQSQINKSVLKIVESME